jgi:hypothetical protein
MKVQKPQAGAMLAQRSQHAPLSATLWWDSGWTSLPSKSVSTSDGEHVAALPIMGSATMANDLDRILEARERFALVIWGWLHCPAW